MRLWVFVSFDFPSDGCYNKRHQGADEVEEAVGKVGESGHSENRGLSHAAGIPRNEDGGDSGNILGGTAKQSGLVALLTIGFAIHVGCEDNRNELIACGEVEEKSCADRGGNKAETSAGKADDHIGDALYHATCHHGRTEAHGTENEPDGV